MKKKEITIIGIILLIVIGIGTYFILTNKKDNKEISDATKFQNEYKEVAKDNVFVYRSVKEIINIMEHGTGVVYLGFKECPWCQYYVKYLDEVAKTVGVTKIYYCDVLLERKNNTKEYQQLIELLNGHLQNNNEGLPRLYVPNVSFHISGKVIGNDYETSLDTNNLKDPKDYWTTEKVNALKEKLTRYMQEVYDKSNQCSTCNK